jgi:hypothetical protein
MLFLEALGALMFLTGMMYGMMRFMLKDIHNDLVTLKQGQLKLEEKIDIINTRSEQRTDHLYEVVIDLLKKK